ncbi:MAG: hypothetical protein E4H37_00295 [Gemmatimonadales bacterium]|nr:MAG: hypothetical protein E4H37_00295 [Gemmatimonadales bacterium]
MIRSDDGGGSHGVLRYANTSTPFPIPGPGLATALETLELPEALDRVAEHAAGPMGRAAIRRLVPTADVDWITRELDLVAELTALLERGDALAADAVPDPTDTIARVRVEGSVLDGTEIALLRRLLSAARTTSATIHRIAPDAPGVAGLLRPLPATELDRTLDRAIDERGEVLDTASRALAAARRTVRSARSRLLQKLEQMLHGLESDTAERGTVTIRAGRYVIPVRRDTRHRPPGIIHDESASQETLFVEPSATIELGNALREAEAAEEREVLRVLRDLSRLLRDDADGLQNALDMGVAFDALVARAKYAVAVGGHRPDVTAAPAPLTVIDARHPLLLGGTTEVVPCSLCLEAGERTVVVSGPNAGGKTVALKTVGLVAAMTQAGIIPPIGPESRLPVFGGFFVDIGDHQSIAANLSTFSAHVRALRDTLEHADDASLVLIDEIGSGTDPAEGAALAEAALGALTRAGATTLASTHLGALKRLAETLPGVVNASLQFDPETVSPTYRLEKGVPGRSYGIAIARRLGLPEALLQEAESHVPAGERALDALLADLEWREKKLREAEEEVSARTERIATDERRLADQAGRQDERESELERRMRDAEREGRAQARSYLLEARRRVEEALALARAAVGEATAREARRLVEEGVRQESQAVKHSETITSSGGGVVNPGALDIGTRVELVDGTVGEVVGSRSDGRLELRVGAMRLVVDTGQVAGAVEAERVAAPRTSTTFSRQAETGAVLDLDLRGMTGDEAEAATLAAIDRAILADQPYLRIIHGKGTGVVRDRVLHVVSTDRRVARHQFATREAGGTGVTIVEFTP